MNKRIVSMIRKLSNTEQEISLTELAEEFQISQRTVRNDLNVINDLLTEQTLANIRLGKGGRILRQEDFPEILKSLDEKDFYDYKLSKEERKKNQEISFRVIVACHAGIGTSRLLLERLKKHFNFRIVDIVSSHEAGNLKEDQADLVISTVPLKSCAIEMVVVSPLLKDEDYIEIGNKLERLQTKKLKKKELQTEKSQKEVTDSTAEIPRTPEMLLQGIGDLLYERVPEEAEELIHEIQKKLADFFQTDKVKEEGYTPALGQLLTETHIRLDVECKDWRQAVQASAETLLHKGYIKDSYIDAMIHNIEENGPYIVLTKGFAVPHEGIDKGVYKTGMSLIRLKDPVNFDAEENDPVEIVCCMCATDHKTHLRAFFNLVNMLKTPGFLKSLQETTTPEETAEVIRHYEKMAERKQREL